jgi:hypothetical protein
MSSLSNRLARVEDEIDASHYSAKSDAEVQIAAGFWGFLVRAVGSRRTHGKLIAHADRLTSPDAVTRADTRTLLEAAGVCSREAAFVLLFWQHSRVRLRLHELGLPHVCGVWCASPTSPNLEPEEMSSFAVYWFGKLCEEEPTVAALPSVGAEPVENPDLISSFGLHIFDADGMLCQPRDKPLNPVEACRYPVFLPSVELSA